MSYYREPRHTHEEWERYAPTQYRRFDIVLRILRPFLLIFAIGLAYAIGKGDDTPSWIGWSLGSIAIAFVIVGLVLPGLSMQLDYLVDDAYVRSVMLCRQRSPKCRMTSRVLQQK